MKKTTLALAMPLVAVFALAGCSPTGSDSPSGDALTKVTVGISPFQDTYLPIIGQEKGWFEEAGLDVEMRTLAWNAAMPALISGDIDIAVNNTTGVVSVANSDPSIVYAYGWNPFTEGSALMIHPDGDLKTIEELEKKSNDHEDARTEFIQSLKDKTIVTTLSTDMGKQIIDALASVGMTDEDVKFVDMDPDSGLAAFLTGTGDAYLGGVPQRGTALDAGMVVGLAGPDLAAPPINGAVTTRGFIDDHEDDLLAFIDVMHRIIRYCDAETDACAQTITQRLNAETAAGLTVEGFKDYWQSIELYAPNAQAASDMILAEDGVSYWKSTWDSDNAYLVETGGIPAAVDADTNFLMPDIWEAYVEKYGADQTEY